MNDFIVALKELQLKLKFLTQSQYNLLQVQ